eukprot:TRINITY_DN43985_c0_g1_i1.p2 TRINITY_DN43985_c0_g1~~TRINITY_DN43985_c0_g1_i1.p2  ORF type:complete len:175 (+),score=11.60 TRINITY_DN43985_c0_g1_i1:499-1023(+)
MPSLLQHSYSFRDTSQCNLLTLIHHRSLQGNQLSSAPPPPCPSSPRPLPNLSGRLGRVRGSADRFASVKASREGGRARGVGSGGLKVVGRQGTVAGRVRGNDGCSKGESNGRSPGSACSFATPPKHGDIASVAAVDPAPAAVAAAAAPPAAIAPPELQETSGGEKFIGQARKSS